MIIRFFIILAPIAINTNNNKVFDDDIRLITKLKILFKFEKYKNIKNVKC